MARYQPRHAAAPVDAPSDATRRTLLRVGAGATVVGATTLVAPGAAQAASRPTLKTGSRGTHVRTLQSKLRSKGYWLGGVDGVYGLSTQQAVMAVQKMHGLTRDGVCGPKTWSVVNRMGRPRGRTRSGNIIEINKSKQVVLVIEGGRVKWVFNTSTGARRTPTPSGRFRIERSINGMRNAPLGQLWRPRYFYRGYALHGSRSIPGYPASHGCARLSNPGINHIWRANLAPIGRRVWVY